MTDHEQKFKNITALLGVYDCNLKMFLESSSSIAIQLEELTISLSDQHMFYELNVAFLMQMKSYCLLCATIMSDPFLNR